METKIVPTAAMTAISVQDTERMERKMDKENIIRYHSSIAVLIDMKQKASFRKMTS